MLAKILKQKRDAEDRLRSNSPQTVFVPGAPGDIEGTETIQTILVDGDLVEAFTDLTDVPNTYIGQSGKVLACNTLENGLEFIEISAGGDGAFDFGLITNTVSTTQDWGALS